MEYFLVFLQKGMKMASFLHVIDRTKYIFISIKIKSQITMTASIINKEQLWHKIGNWARKVGRATTRPVLLLYYVMTSKDTPRKDKAIIFAAISYLVLPVDLISAKRLPIIGWLDEATSLVVTIQRMQKYITPEMKRRADETLERWFPEYAEFEEIEMDYEHNVS